MLEVSFHPDSQVLLVVEGRAACPPWPSHLGAPPEQGWSVLEQEEWEPLGSFSVRLNDALARVAILKERLVVALVTSRCWDAPAVGARRRLALDILAHLADCEGGVLLLSHGHQHDGACREALDALATELAPEWSDSRVTVSARFEERPRREPRRASSPAFPAAEQATAT